MILAEGAPSLKPKIEKYARSINIRVRFSQGKMDVLEIIVAFSYSEQSKAWNRTFQPWTLIR